MTKIDILTLFPEMFRGPFSESIVKHAQKKCLVKINLHNLRDWAADRHKTVDNRPYGGGPGMVMRVDVIDSAIASLKSKKSKIILLTPQGKIFNQKKARSLAKEKHLIFICGHYEGVDERVRQHLIDGEISIGDYILTGGELPAMVVTDAVVRLIPGAVSKPESVKEESFSSLGEHDTNHGGKKKKVLLEYPQYTRPAEYKNWSVPEVLLNGNHREIERWRKLQAVARTKKRRPDLL